MSGNRDVFSIILAQPDDGTPQQAQLRAILRTTAMIVENDAAVGLALLVGAIVVLGASSTSAVEKLQIAIDALETAKSVVSAKQRSAGVPEDRLS